MHMGIGLAPHVVSRSETTMAAFCSVQPRKCAGGLPSIWTQMRVCVCVIALLHARVRDWICNQYTAPPNRAERSVVVKSAACVLERRECACEIISGQNQTMPSLNATGLHSFITCCLCGTVEQWRRCLLSSNELKNISSRDDCAELALVCVCVCALLVSAAT